MKCLTWPVLSFERGDMKTLRSINTLTLKNDYYPLLRLSIPLVITGIMQSAISFFENIFLAQLGPEYLAAGALVAWLFATIIVVIFGTLGAINVLVAHKHGADDVAGISKVTRDGIVLALMLVVPVFLLLWNMAPIFLLVGQHPYIVGLATHYLRALAFGLLPKFIMIVLIEFMLGLGLARLITLYAACTIPIYIFLSWALIFGRLGFPELGIAGAGWGMTIGDWISTIILCLYVFYSPRFENYRAGVVKGGSPYYFIEILKLGAPMGMMYCIEVGFFFAMALLIGTINIQSLSANQLAMQYLGPLMGTIFSIAQALTIRMGHEIGGKNVSMAIRAAYAGIVMVILYMSFIAALYYIFPDALISVDFNLKNAANTETIKFARDFIYIAALFQVIEAVRITLYGALRGFKDTHYSLLASVISFWLIALPVGYVFSHYLHLGGAGYWWGMVLGASCSVMLLYRRFIRISMRERL